MKCLFAFSALTIITCSRRDSGLVETVNGPLNYNEDWGYYQIRPSAYMFWWLFSVNATEERPLLLWHTVNQNF